jgi:hypothetical protein
MSVIREVIAGYAKASFTGEPSYLTQNDDGNLITVVDVYIVDGKTRADTGLVVRIEGEYVVIDHDMNNKLLVDALVQAGIPREQIILAYAGEPVPETAA